MHRFVLSTFITLALLIVSPSARAQTPGEFTPPAGAAPLHATANQGGRVSWPAESLARDPEVDRWPASSIRASNLSGPTDPTQIGRTTFDSGVPNGDWDAPKIAPTSRPSPRKKAASLRISPPGGDEESSSRPGSAASGSLVTVGSSLAVVLGLFFLVAWLMRRGMPKGSGPLPSEVAEMLGRLPLMGKQQGHVLRFGNKLVLVSLMGNSATPIAEITDPAEVDRLAGLCRQSQGGSATAAFRQVFQQLSRDPAPESVPEEPVSIEPVGAGYHDGFRPTTYDAPKTGHSAWENHHA